MAFDSLPLFDHAARDWRADLSEADRQTLDAARAILQRCVACGDVVSSWSALQDYLAAHLAPQRRETVHVLYLDRQNRIISAEDAGTGSVSHAPVYPREIARRAIMLDASAVILAHNHPSGSTEPSQVDIDMSRAVLDALDALDITLHDSVICGGAKMLSMRAEGLL